MKFGIFFELSVPRPFMHTLNEYQVYANALEQARRADELGFDHIWAVEHHFLEEYSHCSAPEVLLAAIAAQTKRIRLGHGAVVCVPEMNHPVRIAERAAALDLISGGRLEFGTARSSTWTELGGFQADPDETKKTWDEFVRTIPKMWTQDCFSWQGTSFSMPERNVLPKPLQLPHPPMWVTVTSPGTELDAAQRGLGCLGVAAVSYQEQERRTRQYRQMINNCEPAGSVINDRVHTMNFLYCHDDAAQAVRTGLPMVQTFNLTNSHLLWTREAYATRAYRGIGNIGQALAQASSPEDPGAAKALPEGLGVGDPAHVVHVIEQWESLGVDGVNFIVNASELLTQEQVLASMDLFAREVMPKFRDGDEAKAPVTTPTSLPKGI